jgi:hypothetical protein
MGRYLELLRNKVVVSTAEDTLSLTEGVCLADTPSVPAQLDAPSPAPETKETKETNKAVAWPDGDVALDAARQALDAAGRRRGLTAWQQALLLVMRRVVEHQHADRDLLLLEDGAAWVNETIATWKSEHLGTV